MKKELKWFSVMLVNNDNGSILDIKKKNVCAYSASEAAKDFINKYYQLCNRSTPPTKCLIKVYYEMEKCFMGKKIQSNRMISIAPYTYKRPKLRQK